MDRRLLQKSSSPLVGEMGEGHGWWSVTNNPSPFFTPTASPSHSFSSLLLSNQLPQPWPDTNHPKLQDSWSHLLLCNSGPFEAVYQTATGACSTAEAADGSGVKPGSYGGSYMYSTSSHGCSEEIAVPRPSPWSHHSLEASSPRSCTTSCFGSNFFELPATNSSSPDHCISTASGAAFKKARIQGPAQPTVKVRKERLGDRITALHQLVSPFGKTDTASVLLEAIGYIRFLHTQIQALSSPYLGCTSSSSSGGGGGACGNNTQQQQQQDAASAQGESNCIFPEDPGQLLQDNAKNKRGYPDQLLQDNAKNKRGYPNQEGTEGAKDLRSRGLCLIPVSCTLDVGNDCSPADFWAPAFGMGFGR